MFQLLTKTLAGAGVLVGSVQLEVEPAGAEISLGDSGRIVADRKSAVLRLPEVATFGIEDGRRVVVEPADGVEPAVVDGWLNGLVAALVLAQRGRFALHANLVELDGATLALAGARAAGKTTTSLLLSQRGGTLLADDVLPLTPGEGWVVHSTTGRGLRIDPETAATLDWDTAGAERVGPSAQKLVFAQRASVPSTLDGIVVLSVAEVATVECSRLGGTDAVHAVLANAYRRPVLKRLWNTELFSWAAAVSAGVQVHRVRRPVGRWSGDEVAAAVEELAAGMS
jgi:hypothetical protein